MSPLLLLFISQLAVATGSLDMDGGMWSHIEITVPLSNPNFRNFTEIHARFSGKKPALDCGILRTAFGYRFHRHLHGWLGYDFKPSLVTDTSHYEIEHRTWQALSGRLIKNVGWRTRFEQRFVPQCDKVVLRLRQKLIYRFIKRNGAKPAMHIATEFFFNLNHPDCVTNKVINQVRTTLYGSFLTTKQTAWRVGYLNQYRPSEPYDRMTHILYVAVIMVHH